MLIVRTGVGMLLAVAGLAAGPLDSTVWERDLAILASTIQTRHPAPFEHVTEADFRRRVGEVRRRLQRPESDAVRAVRLAGVAAMVGDGHTSLQVYDDLPRLPLRWAWFGGTLRVTAAPAKRWLGASVMAIGGHPIGEAVSRISPLIPAHESASFVANWSQYLLRIPDALSAMGIAGPATRGVPIRVRTLDGRESVWTLRAVEAVRDVDTDLAVPFDSPPLARSRSDAFWFMRVPDSPVAYLHFSGYPAIPQMRATAEALVKTLASGEVHALLVDLRANTGGDFKQGRRLIDLLRGPIAEHHIAVYVAIGRQTFSAGMTNATDFKAAFGAPYLGEVSGAKPNGYQENGAFELPGTRIKGSVAQAFYRFQAEDTAGLQPDIPLPPTWDDYQAGRDPVLTWALAAAR